LECFSIDKLKHADALAYAHEATKEPDGLDDQLSTILPEYEEALKNLRLGVSISVQIAAGDGGDASTVSKSLVDLGACFSKTVLTTIWNRGRRPRSRVYYGRSVQTRSPGIWIR
jgi:hypothetical protein